MGPDLLGVGKRLTKAQILDSILDPSKLIDPKFAGVLIQTTDGDVLSGVLVERSEERLVLCDAEGQRELKASRVARLVPQSKSMMPDGLLQDLSAQEAADLVEYLVGLK
jgi:putative heme-binding domain-containing protein